MEEKAQVRTIRGVNRFGQPLGSVIVPDPVQTRIGRLLHPRRENIEIGPGGHIVGTRKHPHGDLDQFRVSMDNWVYQMHHAGSVNKRRRKYLVALSKPQRLAFLHLLEQYPTPSPDDEEVMHLLRQIITGSSVRRHSLSTAKESTVYGIEFKDRVRTAAGVRKYGQPIGSVIVKDVFRKVSVNGKKNGKGTVDDPIAVEGDLKLAVNLIAKGHHVRLNQPDEVTIVLDKLAKRVNYAIQRGDKAPNFNLCLISIPGTNLFCESHKGIERVKMPQLSGVPEEGSIADSWPRVKGDEVNGAAHFRAALKERGISTKNGEIRADHLRATQSELVGPKVAGIAGAMEEGKIPEQRIFVSRDNYVLDGHHRWAAKVAKDARDGHLGDEMMLVEIIDADIGAILDFANEWTEAVGLPHVGMVNNTSVRQKSIEDTMEEKGVRYVRTLRGAIRFGQEIGDIIVPDKEPGAKRGAHKRLQHLTVEQHTRFPGYAQLRGANGKVYWVGPYPVGRKGKVKWIPTDEQENIVVGDINGFPTEEEALRALDAKIRPRLGWTREVNGERVANVRVRQATREEMQAVEARKKKPHVVQITEQDFMKNLRKMKNDWPDDRLRKDVEKIKGRDGNIYYLYRNNNTHMWHVMTPDKRKLWGRKGYYDREGALEQLAYYVEGHHNEQAIQSLREQNAKKKFEQEAEREIFKHNLPNVGQTVKFGPSLRKRGKVTEHGVSAHKGIKYPFITVLKGNGKTERLYPAGSPLDSEQADAWVVVAEMVPNKPITKHIKKRGTATRGPSRARTRA